MRETSSTSTAPSAPQVLRWILKDKYNWSTSDIFQFLDDLSTQKVELSPEVAEDFRRWKLGEPLQYIIGWTPFLDCQIDLRYKPLIPRPETEFWVQKIIEKYSNWHGKKDLRVLDLCCGSGCIGIAILKHVPQSNVTFADVSAAAVAQTKVNVDLNRIAEERVKIVESDLFSAVEGKFDVIVSNPPYIDPTDEVGPEVKYEPKEALFAEEKGLAVIKKIVGEAQNFLEDGGELVMEFGKGQGDKVHHLIEQQKFSEVELHQDQFEVARWATGKK
jgi:release factor glutamine methyltransferase